MAEVGQALQRLRPGDPVGRVANGVLAVGYVVREADEARRIAAYLQQVLEAPVRLGDHTVDITLTLGLAVYPDLVDRPSALVNRASVAVDQARAPPPETGAVRRGHLWRSPGQARPDERDAAGHRLGRDIHPPAAQI